MQRLFSNDSFQKGCQHSVFRTNVEQELLWNPKRPPHKFDLALAIFVEENDRLDGIGSNGSK
jgi:hypothetical protein